MTSERSTPMDDDTARIIERLRANPDWPDYETHGSRLEHLAADKIEQLLAADRIEQIAFDKLRAQIERLHIKNHVLETALRAALNALCEPGSSTHKGILSALNWPADA
jgi:hypothetical protein